LRHCLHIKAKPRCLKRSGRASQCNKLQHQVRNADLGSPYKQPCFLLLLSWTTGLYRSLCWSPRHSLPRIQGTKGAG